MKSENRAYHGHWRLWITEIPQLHVHDEDLIMFPSGKARWSVKCGLNQESHTEIQWRFDDEGRLLLVTKAGSMLSRCLAEVSGDLMTLTPTHGFSTLFERVDEAEAEAAAVSEA